MEMPESRTPNRTPTALALSVTAALLLALAPTVPAAAQTSDWQLAGELLASEPTFHRPYLFEGVCYLSSVGTAVRFDVHEFILDDTVAPADFAASLCQGAEFDTVLFLYQRPTGAPGAFYAEDPCARLVLYSDDYCGSASQVWSTALALGHVSVVVTSFANGQTGAYTLTADSALSQLQDFIYYGGFETGNLRTWSDAFTSF
jgi:hypothetical protein